MLIKLTKLFVLAEGKEQSDTGKDQKDFYAYTAKEVMADVHQDRADVIRRNCQYAIFTVSQKAGGIMVDHNIDNGKAEQLTAQTAKQRRAESGLWFCCVVLGFKVGHYYGTG